MSPRTHLVLVGIGLIGLVGCNEYGIVEDPDNIGVIAVTAVAVTVGFRYRCRCGCR